MFGSVKNGLDMRVSQPFILWYKIPTEDRDNRNPAKYNASLELD